MPPFKYIEDVFKEDVLILPNSTKKYINGFLLIIPTKKYINDFFLYSYLDAAL